MVEQFFPAAAGPLATPVCACTRLRLTTISSLIATQPIPTSGFSVPVRVTASEFAPALAELLTKTLTTGTDGQVAPSFCAVARDAAQPHCIAVSDD